MDGDSKLVAASGKRKPPAAGMGRKKGSVNKVTKQVKEMILGALDDAGGQDYLALQARENPTAFMTLVGKVLPLQLTGDGGDAIKMVHKIERCFVGTQD